MDNRKAVVRNTRKYGKGVYARSRIHKGELIAVFDGPVLGDDFVGWNDDINRHAIQVGPSIWRDSIGIARWINHSCSPNCGIKRRNRVVAMRDIEAGEQLTWDYEMTEKSDWWRMRCRCGSPECRRWIGNFKNMPRQIRERYRGFISTWLVPARAKVSKRRSGRSGP